MSDLTSEREAEIRALAEGGASVLCCDHPDIAGSAIDDPYRQCAIDQGFPSECGMSDPDGSEGITDKINCPFWREVRDVEPVGVDAETTLSLLDSLASTRERAERAEALLGIAAACAQLGDPELYDAMQRFARDTGALAGTNVRDWFVDHKDTLRLRWEVQNELFARATAAEARVVELEGVLREAGEVVERVLITIDRQVAAGLRWDADDMAAARALAAKLKAGV